MSKRYSGKSFKDSSVMKKPKLTFKERRKLKEEKKRKNEKAFRDLGSECHGTLFSESMTIKKCCYSWWPGTESNRRHKPFQGSALPSELPGLIRTYKLFYL